MIRLDVCALTPSLKAAEVIIANKRKKKKHKSTFDTH